MKHILFLQQSSAALIPPIPLIAFMLYAPSESGLLDYVPGDGSVKLSHGPLCRSLLIYVGILNCYYERLHSPSSRTHPLSNHMRLENGEYLQLCYLDFMLLPMYINTDYSLLCTLRVYPQFNVSASHHCPDLLGAIQHLCWWASDYYMCSRHLVGMWRITIRFLQLHLR